MKRKRMGTVFGTWLQRGYIMIWERLSKWRKLGDLLDTRLLQHGWAQQGLGTSCVTSVTVTLVQRFHSAVEQEGGYICCKGFFSQNHSGRKPGQRLIAVHSNFNFFYINIMRRCLSFSWKFWGWDIGENKQRDTLRALWAVNGSLWHALTGHFILALLNQLNGENSKLIAKLLWQFLFTTVVINRCCYPLCWEPNIPWGRFV